MAERPGTTGFEDGQHGLDPVRMRGGRMHRDHLRSKLRKTSVA